MNRMISGIKPSGELTLGNYIGAISQFVKFQEEYEMYVFVANQHAITVAHDPKALKKNTKDLIALYLACGLDPEKTTLFLQSDIPAHVQLGWILTCHTYMGELQRMTQYKDKMSKGEQNLTAGLFTYPSLMAADILLYDAQYVPVGIDQKQHVELTRDLAERFNNRYGETFVVPTPITPKVGAKIMSLSEPTKKMSKSEGNNKGCIFLLEDPNIARKKIMSAMTDSLGKVQYDPEHQPGIANLLTIHSVLSNTPIEELVATYQDAGYGDFKKAVAEVVYQFLVELQARYHDIMAEKQVERVVLAGREKAQAIAFKKMRKVNKKIGFEIF